MHGSAILLQGNSACNKCPHAYINVLLCITVFTVVLYAYLSVKIPVVCRPLEHQILPRNRHTQYPTGFLHRPPPCPAWHWLLPPALKLSRHIHLHGYHMQLVFKNITCFIVEGTPYIYFHNKPLLAIY